MSAIRRTFVIMGVFGFSIFGIQSIHDYWRIHQDFDWREAAAILKTHWHPDDALVFVPDWQLQSYLANGGELVNVAPAHDLDRIRNSNRIWLMMWEQAPPESGRVEIQTLRDNVPSQVLLDHPLATLTLMYPRQTAMENRRLPAGFYSPESWPGERVAWTGRTASFLFDSQHNPPVLRLYPNPLAVGDGELSVILRVDADEAIRLSPPAGRWTEIPLNQQLDSAMPLIALEVDPVYAESPAPDARKLGVAIPWRQVFAPNSGEIEQRP